MGFCSWNAVSSNVTEAYLRNITAFMQSSGLASLGYNSIHVDEGWLQGRYPNGTIYEDRTKFPSGMKGFGDWVHSQGFTYGLYTCRGSCQCSTQWYQGPGSLGYEKEDAQWIVDAGADFLKEDSCCGSQDPATAFAEYALMRDALNATGRPVVFALCGWETWYAPNGSSLGNTWRISGDGSGWGPLTVCMNKMAALRQYAGPGGWNDPDLLIGPNVAVGGQTDQQARTQFSLWCVMSAPLIISNDLLTASPFNVETYTNAEAIAVNQDTLGIPGIRLVGDDLTYPCSGGSLPVGAIAGLQVAPCNASDPLQAFFVNKTDNTIVSLAPGGGVVDDYMCATPDDSPLYVYPRDNGQGTCGGANQVWQLNANGAFVNPRSSKCLDVWQYTGPQVDLYTCNGGANQQWKVQGSQLVSQYPPGDLCLSAVAPSAVSCANVWGRPLNDSSAAIAFVNNGPAGANVSVTCDSACFAGVNLTLPSIKSLTVRDLWAHRNISTIYPPFTYTDNVPGDGGSTLYRFIPNY